MRSRRQASHMRADRKSDDGIEPTITVEDRNIKTVSLSPSMMASIKESMERVLRSNPQILKNSIRDCLIGNPTFVREVFNEVLIKNSDLSQFRNMDRSVAKRMISEYIDQNPGCKTSDIIINLEIEPSVVMEILKELKQEGVVQSKSIE